MARAGSRSAMPRTWIPGVRCACERYMEPNLPQPMRPMKIGLLEAERARSWVWSVDIAMVLGR